MTQICSSSLHKRQAQVYFKLLKGYKGILIYFPLQTTSEGRLGYLFLQSWSCLSPADSFPFLMFLEMNEKSKNRPEETNGATSPLKGKYYGLDFSNQDLKVILYFTNATKCSQRFSV